MKKKSIILLTIPLIASSFLIGCNSGGNSSQNDPPIVISEDEKKANEVSDIIKALNENSSEEDINAARTAYNALTNDQKDYVNGEVYQALAELEMHLSEKKEAQNVNAILSSLTSESSESEAINARKAYDLLSSYGQGFVDNNALNVLLNLEKKYADIRINAVIALIKDLTFDEEGNIKEQEDAIKAAREAYDALKEAEQKDVTNLKDLENLEKAVTNYYHQLKVEELQFKLLELATVNRESSPDAVLLAKAKLDAIDLNAYEKAVIDDVDLTYYNSVVSSINDNFTVLYDGSTSLDKWDYPVNCKSDISTTTEVDEIYGSVQAVTLSLDDDPEHELSGSYSLPIFEDIASYDYLGLTIYSTASSVVRINGKSWNYSEKVYDDDGWKTFVIPVEQVIESTYPEGSLGILTTTEGKFKIASIIGYNADKTAAENVTSLITNLDSELETFEQDVINARTAYDNLYVEYGLGTKNAVTNYDLLLEKEQEVKQKYADEVTKAINSLSFDDSLNDEEIKMQENAIKEARSQYDDLDEDTKALVSTDALDKLNALETQISAYYHDQYVDELIAKIDSLSIPSEISEIFACKKALKEIDNYAVDIKNDERVDWTKYNECQTYISQYSVIDNGKTSYETWDYNDIGAKSTTLEEDSTFDYVQTTGQIKTYYYSNSNKKEVSYKFHIFGAIDNYETLYFYVYAPQGGVITFHGANWAFQSYTYSEEGWHLFTVDANQFKNSKYPENTIGVVISGGEGTFKFSPIIAKKGENYNPNVKVTSTVMSSLNDYAHLSIAQNDEKYGDAYGFTSPNTAFSLIWENVSLQDKGFLSDAYVAIYNPTNNDIEGVVFNSADSGWGTISENEAVTLAPGWNEIHFPASMLENTAFKHCAINFKAEQTALMESSGWLITDIFGVLYEG